MTSSSKEASRLFVAEVIVERAAVQAGARAQVAHREAVDATFFDERDEGFAQRGAKRAMRGSPAAAVGSGARKRAPQPRKRQAWVPQPRKRRALRQVRCRTCARVATWSRSGAAGAACASCAFWWRYSMPSNVPLGFQSLVY